MKQREEKAVGAGGTTPKTGRGRNTTADRTADILLLFDAERPVLSAALVASLLGMTRSTTYRYPQTLRVRGLVEADERHDGFRLGPQIHQLARIARLGPGLPEIALPTMREVRDATGELVLLTRRWGGTMVCVERVEGTDPIRLSDDRGRTNGAHAGASAKVLIAFTNADEVDVLLRGAPLTRYTARTVTDPVLLRRQLAAIRERGHAVTEGEVDEGMRSVAAPVFGRGGRIAAALAVTATAHRLDDAALPKVPSTVRGGAAAITERLRDLDP